MTGPLVSAAGQAAARLDSVLDAWDIVAQLYAAAARHLDFDKPKEAEYDSSPLQRLASADVEKPLTIREDRYFINLALEEIEQARTNRDDLRKKSLAVIAEMGMPLYRRLSHVIAFHDPYNENLPSLFTQQVGDQKYRLMLAYYGLAGEYRGKDQSLGQALTKCLPVQGWSNEPPKIMLPHVRVLPFSDNSPPPPVYYLEQLAPIANRQLASLSATEGLSLAAMPMHREFQTKLADTPGHAGAKLFRVVQPDFMPEGWREHLRADILRCSREKVLIAVLPELMGTKEIYEEMRKALSECDNGFPILTVGPSAHVFEKNGHCYNRLPLHCRDASGNYMKSCFYHHKFERYSHEGYVEDCELGPGMTFLVTAIGVLAFGICKDWFFLRSAGEAKGYNQFNQALPVVAVAPAFTGSVLGVEHICEVMRDTRTPFIFANACGPVRSSLRNDNCCGKVAEAEKLYDVRSFIAAPRSWFELDAKECSVSDRTGVRVAKAACRLDQEGPNAVFARCVPTLKKPQA